jgi:cell division protease FtsH
MIGQGYNTAKGILAENNDALVRIALALLEREVLDANEIKLIIEGKELPKLTPPPRSDDNGVQQVLKPEPRPGIAKGGEHPAPA